MSGRRKSSLTAGTGLLPLRPLVTLVDKNLFCEHNCQMRRSPISTPSQLEFIGKEPVTERWFTTMGIDEGVDRLRIPQSPC